MSRSIFRYFLSGLARRVRKPAGSPPLYAEPLEQRRNPVTATWTQDAPGSTTGTLAVNGDGTAGLVNDRIRIRQNGSAQVAVIDFRTGREVAVPIDTPGGTVLFMPASQISGITVNAGLGNDFVDLNSFAQGFEQLSIPATLSGGDGSDTLGGGNAGDTIRGDSGADLLFGNGGDDSIVGGDGNDVMFGSDGD
ncbi:MAG: hypothetical protein J2P46_19950, partial [Zavarzinella sp.]|nr:hypothetical protein [Zavarzinella sp.]